MLLGMGSQMLTRTWGLGNAVSSTYNACAENFWSAACWFTPQGAQSLGIDNAPGTIAVTPPPVSNCAGTLNADGTCTAVISPNDPSGTAQTLTDTGGNYQNAFQNWVTGVTNSAQVGTNNTAGTGYLWMAAIGIGLVALVATGVKGRTR